MSEPFSPPWIAAWAAALRQSDSYRAAARNWEGAVVLEQAPGRGESPDAARSVFLDLWRGECRAAREATAADREAARYVISGPRASWERVLHGELSPTMAIMRGALSLAKGSLGGLLPHVGAATEMLRLAQGLDVAPEPTEAAPAAAAAAAAAAEVAATPTVSTAGHAHFQSTSPTGLRFDSVPMRLWEKAKRFGIWNPTDIDFTQDRADWQRLAADEQDVLLRLAALFQAGEEAVALDILPLADVMAREGRLEEQLYLASFIWEEAKHVELFRRFLDAVTGRRDDLASYHSPSYRTIFAEALPAAMGRLRHDPSPVAQAEASATYNMIVEGVLAETGYHMYHRVLVAQGILPGMQRAVTLLKQDESRHIAYGLHLLSRLVAEHGDVAWHAIEARMNALVAPAVAVVTEAFAAYPPDRIPFGLDPADFTAFAMSQFQRRLAWLERGRRSGGQGDVAGDLLDGLFEGDGSPSATTTTPSTA